MSSDDEPQHAQRLPWWKTSVVYQIYPRSFADGDGDGIGDLTGLLGRLDHLEWLGVGAIWLSPIFPSPMADFGYDVADYCAVDPVFGDLATLDAVVAGCHERGIKVLLDWVPNHTSIEHPWFVESRASRDNPKRDWYIWRDEPPNNWRASFFQNRSAWTLDPATGQYYLHTFLAEQPDLNWDNPQVRAAMADTLRFWLDRGVDGFRMDVVHLIGKDFADTPAEWAEADVSHVPFNDVPVTHDRLREIRAVLDSYPGDRTSVGEVYLLDPERVATYYGHGDELHLSFNFRFTQTLWTADALRSRIATTLATHLPRGAWPTWVLSNHDIPRHRTRFGGDERIARAAAVLLLTLPGTPFLYAGEELGLLDADVPADRVVDPGGRDGCRAPLPWLADGSPGVEHGWPGGAWLPFPPSAGTCSVESELADPSSVLHLYRALLALRNTTPALQAGRLTLWDSTPGVLVYELCGPGHDGVSDDRWLVAVNTTDQPSGIHLGETHWLPVVATDPADAETWPGNLSPYAARILHTHP